EDGIRDGHVTGVQTCALPICTSSCFVDSYQSVSSRRMAILSGSVAGIVSSTKPRTKMNLSKGYGVRRRLSFTSSSVSGQLITFRSEERRVGREAACLMWLYSI